MTTMSDVAETQFDVRDNSRHLTFTGRHLASSSSNTSGDVPRWTDLKLYRTSSGKYVLQKVGRSVVFHSDKCRRRSKGDRFDGLSDVPDVRDFQPGTCCHPSRNVSPVWVERDIYQAVVHENAESLLSALYREDDDGVPFLSRVARTLLETASSDDEKISRVFHSAVDVT